MSEETIFKFKLATLASIVIGLLTIGMSVMGIWITFINNEVSTHGKAIATLTETDVNHKEMLVYIRGVVDDIRDDQIRRKNGLEREALKALGKANR